MTAPASHVVMGKIGAPWGVKGWVKLFSFTNPAENLLDYRSFWVAGSNGLKPLEFVAMRSQGGDFVGQIKGCEVREQAAGFTGVELLVEKSDLPALDEGYYWHQLEGLRVVTLGGQDLGTVQYLMETGANDVMVIKGDGQSVDRVERLLPWLRGRVVTEVDLTKRVIKVDWDAAWLMEADKEDSRDADREPKGN